MQRWRSFASVPKEEMHLSVPRGLMKEFREYARSMDYKPNELATYMLCQVLRKDPTEFGLHEWCDRIVADD